MTNDVVPLAQIMRIVVALVVGGIGLWAFLNKKGKEEEAARQRQSEEDRKSAEAAAA